MISKPLKVQALDNYNISVSFEDGLSGSIDLSHLRGKGVFSLWDNYENFKKVYIDNETAAIAWSKEVELDPTNLYLKIAGKTLEEWKKEQLTHAADK